jgi:glycosyltransferase involved in cell wall biosynthesis
VVGHVDHTVEPGGAELDLARVLTSRPGWRPYLFAPTGADGHLGVFDALDPNDVGLRRLAASEAGAATTKSSAKRLRIARSLLRNALLLRRAVTREHLAVLHANTTRSAVVAALAVAGRRRVRLVVHLRDAVDEDSLGALGFRLFTGLALRRANAVIANSRFTLATARPHLRERCLAVVVTSSFGGSPSPRVRASGSALKFALVARLDEWKGQHLVVEAFARAFPDSGHELHFAGGSTLSSGDYETSLVRLASELRVTDRVVFHGHVEDMDGFLDSVDVGVQYSTRPEPLGQNVLQYLGAGLPTIVADEGGPPEWIVDGRNGILVAPRSVSALTDAMRRVATDAALFEALSRGACQSVLPTLDDATAAWWAVYGELTQGRA